VTRAHLIHPFVLGEFSQRIFVDRTTLFIVKLFFSFPSSSTVHTIHPQTFTTRKNYPFCTSKHLVVCFSLVDDDDSWYKDGIPLMSDGGVSNQPGLWGGKISSTQVKLNITQEMNGVKIACQGTNEALQRSINEAIELQVLCEY
jgi:hypothetical protein